MVSILESIREKKVVINTNERQITEHIYMSMDERVTGLNNNIMIVGGSGAGKTFRVARPLLRQMTGSYISIDPKGELERKEGRYLEERGYEIQVINMKNRAGMKRSARFNPFAYLRDDNDIQKLSTNIMANTAPKDSSPKDPFFDGAAGMLLTALITYVFENYKDQPEKMNFRTVMELLAMADFELDPQTYAKKESELDKLFNEFEQKENRRILKEQREGKRPKSMSSAVYNYNKVMRSAADTVRSIVVTLDERLYKLHSDELLDLLSEDDIHIEELGLGVNYDGKTKKAVFLVIPDNDTSYNFVVGMFYTMAFQRLEEVADTICEGILPISVTMLMDEFANVALPDDFKTVLATMRSRNMNAVIILQNLADLKAKYEKTWESIVGNCDTFIYLGGNEQSTHKYVSEQMGKGTYDKRTHGETSGQYGNASKNYDVVGRELMTPGEVRKLDNRKCIVFIKGFDPILDDKIRTHRHPLFKYIKEDYQYDRRKHVRGKMYFVSGKYADVVRREEEYEEKKKILEIDGELLKQLSSEAINKFSSTSWYKELSDELIKTEAAKSEEKLRNMPVSDRELSEMDNRTMEQWLLLRGEGYSDRQIRTLIKVIATGKNIEEVKKIFPTATKAESMELLAEKIMKTNIKKSESEEHKHE